MLLDMVKQVLENERALIDGGVVDGGAAGELQGVIGPVESYSLHSSSQLHVGANGQAAGQVSELPTQLPTINPIPKKPISKLWSIWIKKIYEVDPLVCSRCGAQMKIVAFIQDPKEIAKLTKNLGISQQRAPPLKAPRSSRSTPVRYFEPDLTQLQEQGRGE